MQQNSNYFFKPALTLGLALAILFAVGTGCGGITNPFRDYSSKPFNSKDWRAGDAIERGRMMRDLYNNRALGGKSKAAVAELLGEPDRKATVEGKEIWQYRVELAGESPSNYFSVSFKDDKASLTGTD
jgi:hypothetical protein